MSDYYEEVADMMLASIACRHVPRDVLLRKLHEMSESELRSRVADLKAKAALLGDDYDIVYDTQELAEAYAKQRAMK